MTGNLVVGGLLGQGLVTAGFLPPLVTTIIDYADPRQGTILFPDTDPLAVNPRMGTILYPDSDPLGVDPRMGSVISTDTDPEGVDPRRGTVIN